MLLKEFISLGKLKSFYLSPGQQGCSLMQMLEVSLVEGWLTLTFLWVWGSIAYNAKLNDEMVTGAKS